LAAVVFSGDVLGARPQEPLTEVVVTLEAPSMARFGRSLASASHRDYLRMIESEQATAIRRVESAVPEARVRWRYHTVANGFAVVLPRSEVAELKNVPGVAEVWPNVRYHALAAAAGVSGWQLIGADKLWGTTFDTAGNGMKIGIIDDGLDANHPYFDPSGFQYPAGFPKGQVKYATPKVIVQRTFAPPSPTWKYANVPFDPQNSFHATHVAGIAAGDHGANANGSSVSGVAPNAWIGNYKALTIPTPDFGLDGNSAEIAAAIEAAVNDGMNVINLSLGEPEVEPSRDLVVHAIDAAAQAGVVPVVAAGNDFDEFGYGSVSSPGNAPGAITVAAVSLGDEIADFSSAGPTPVSLGLKPDVSAPGVGILSSLPPSQGTWGLLSGTSMATPHVAGAAALLKERHPTWSVEQIKSALVLTGDPVRGGGTAEVPATREGGGLIDLAKADNPLVFAAPTSFSFGVLGAGAAATRSVALTDAGSGAGAWQISTTVTQPLAGAQVTAPATVTVPGTLTVQASAGSASTGDLSGFVVLTRGTDVRRIPFWVGVSTPQLGHEKALPLTRPGTYEGTTVGGASLVTRYRYPTQGDASYPGPERVYRLTIQGRPANFGVAVLSGHVVPHVVLGADENHLAGYTALPQDVNPYRKQFGASRRVAGVVLPARGTYEIVFDTPPGGRPGPFTFRLWIGDTTPPRLRAALNRGGIDVSATDTGAGVDRDSVTATVDGHDVTPHWRNGLIHIAAAPGRHRLVVTAADYQETKNMEDVARVLPNTATLRAIVTVRR
jgi:subtilisin family serine protease